MGTHLACILITCLNNRNILIYLVYTTRFSYTHEDGTVSVTINHVRARTVRTKLEDSSSDKRHIYTRKFYRSFTSMYRPINQINE